MLTAEDQVIKDHVNGHHISNAYYSTGMWTCLAAMVLLFLGMFIVLFTCFSARKAKKSNTYGRKTGNDTGMYDNGGEYSQTTTRRTRKKRFGIF